MIFVILIMILEWRLEYQFQKNIGMKYNETELFLGILPVSLISLDVLCRVLTKEISEVLPFNLSCITLFFLCLINGIKIIRLKKIKRQKGINLIIYSRIIYFLSMSIILVQKIIQIYQNNV